MKCRDCGERDYISEKSSRSDVCDDCWDLRGQLIRGAGDGKISIDRLKAVQKSMRGDIFRKGYGAKKMKEVLSEAGN